MESSGTLCPVSPFVRRKLLEGFVFGCWKVQALAVSIPPLFLHQFGKEIRRILILTDTSNRREKSVELSIQFLFYLLQSLGKTTPLLLVNKRRIDKINCLYLIGDLLQVFVSDYHPSHPDETNEKENRANGSEIASDLKYISFGFAVSFFGLIDSIINHCC